MKDSTRLIRLDDFAASFFGGEHSLFIGFELNEETGEMHPYARANHPGSCMVYPKSERAVIALLDYVPDEILLAVRKDLDRRLPPPAATVRKRPRKDAQTRAFLASLTADRSLSLVADENGMADHD